MKFIVFSFLILPYILTSAWGSAPQTKRNQWSDEVRSLVRERYNLHHPTWPKDISGTLSTGFWPMIAEECNGMLRTRKPEDQPLLTAKTCAEMCRGPRLRTRTRSDEGSAGRKRLDRPETTAASAAAPENLFNDDKVAVDPFEEELAQVAKRGRTDLYYRDCYGQYHRAMPATSAGGRLTALGIDLPLMPVPLLAQPSSREHSWEPRSAAEAALCHTPGHDSSDENCESQSLVECPLDPSSLLGSGKTTDSDETHGLTHPPSVAMLDPKDVLRVTGASRAAAPLGRVFSLEESKKD